MSSLCPVPCPQKHPNGPRLGELERAILEGAAAALRPREDGSRRRLPREATKAQQQLMQRMDEEAHENRWVWWTVGRACAEAWSAVWCGGMVFQLCRLLL